MLPCVCSVNRSQRTSKCGKNISDTLGYRLVCHFFVLTTFWRHLRSITEQTHGNMESICWLLRNKGIWATSRPRKTETGISFTQLTIAKWSDEQMLFTKSPEVSLWNWFPSTLFNGGIWKCNNVRSYWICVWGKFVFEKLRFQIGFYPHENVKPRFTFSGLKAFWRSTCFRDE